MRARLMIRLADAWWRLSGRPSPWTRRERRAAVRAVEELLQVQARRIHPASGSSNPSDGGH